MRDSEKDSRMSRYCVQSWRERAAPGSGSERNRVSFETEKDAKRRYCADLDLIPNEYCELEIRLSVSLLSAEQRSLEVRPAKITQLVIKLAMPAVECWALYFFKVAFSTFWFKFGANPRRQAERRDSGTRQKASNLAQPIS